MNKNKIFIINIQMLEDKYQGNSQFINYGNQFENNQMKEKLDQIHNIIHTTFDNKMNNINQSNYVPTAAQQVEIQTNEIVPQQSQTKSQQQQKLEHDYVNQFQVHQKIQQQKQQVKQQQIQQIPQELEGYQPQQQAQAQADLSSSLDQGNFQMVQTKENQIAEHQHQQQIHQQQQQIQRQQKIQQEQVKEVLQNQYVHLPTNMPQPTQTREQQVIPKPFQDDPTVYAQFKTQQTQQVSQQRAQQRQQQGQQQLQQNAEILNKQKKDDINILIILVIFAIIFLF